MSKLQILMSTYNGEKYLREQLDSILQQDCEEKGIAEVSLLIRDDGSKDATQEILQEYSERYSTKVEWYQGENKGVIKSFFELMDRADDAADYYAFSDQDDYWMPEKMSYGVSAISQLENAAAERPYLYCCRPKLVDENLKDLESEIVRPPMRPGFGNALIENIVTGCTAVFNRKLRDMAIVKLPTYTFMHDWWLYLIATCFGEVVYDETPHIGYRQHGGNVVGNNVSKWHELRDRIRLFKKKKHNASRQVTEFLSVFDVGKVQEEKRESEANDLHRGKAEIQELVHDNAIAQENLVLAREMIAARRHFTKRVRFVRKHKVYRQRKGDHKVFMFFLLIGMY